jgi:hypothetical protein
MPTKTKKTNSQSYTRSTARPGAFTRSNKIVAISLCMILVAIIGTVQTKFGHADSQVTLVCDLQSSHVCMHLTTAKPSKGAAVNTSSFNATTPSNGDTPPEDFDVEYLFGMCHDGLVDSTCPFRVGSGLNSRYNNDSIIQFKYMGGGNYCIGDLSNHFPFAGLQACNNLNGNGGGQATIFVVNSRKLNPSNYIENRYWSNIESSSVHDQPAWLCNLSSKGNLLDLDGSNSLKTACQWIPEN